MMSFLGNAPQLARKKRGRRGERTYRRLATSRRTYNAIRPSRSTDRPRSMRSGGLFGVGDVSNGNKQREPDDKTYTMTTSGTSGFYGERVSFISSSEQLSVERYHRVYRCTWNEA